MNRPTRVPASSVVRINNASNMIAKWYHNSITAGAERPRKDLRHPHRQRRGPARPRKQGRLADVGRELLHMRVGNGDLDELTHSAAAGPLPTTPAGLLIAKYTPGWSITAAIIAITATNDSISIAP